MREKERALGGEDAKEWKPRRDGCIEVDDEEIKEAMRKQMMTHEIRRKKRTRKAPRKGSERRLRDSEGGTGRGDVEWMETVQKINVQHLERWLVADGVKTEKEQSCAQTVLAEAVKGDGWLRQKYRRSVEGGRWHATGKAQLQSSSRKVRATALHGQGLELDMDNAHITLLIAAAEAAKGGGSREWKWLRRYAEDKGRGRRQVAEGFGTTTDAAKNLFFTLMFGGTVQSWARRWNICREKTCEFKNQSEGAKLAYGFAGEVKKAGCRVTEGKGRSGERRATTLQKCLSRMEEQVMRVVRGAVEAKGFTVGTLVHDAVTVNWKNERDEGEAVKREVSETVDLWVHEYVVSQGWRSKKEGGVSFTATLL